MSDAGYIYVRNWQKRQHHKYDSPPWHKVYNDTLRDDDYLGLSHADRGLLQDLWTLASLSGDGRVSADRTFLARHLNVRRVSLEPLIHAGFIEVLSTKQVRSRTHLVSPEKEKSREEPPNPLKGGTENGSSRRTGTNPRSVAERAARNSRRAATIAACKRTYAGYLEEGEPPERAREWMLNEYRNDPSIVDEAIKEGAA